jgi:diguanylate cyclase (GGDEF)-like protein/PAS domain S-box-containing protein
MNDDHRGRGGRMPKSAWFRLRVVVMLTIVVAGWLLPAGPSAALEPIQVNPKYDSIEITSRGEIWDNRGDSLQVETAAGLDGVVGRMDVKAATPGTNPNWIVFALTNRSDRHIERWLTAERYNSVGSGGVWPDLDARRITSVTPSIGFVPERVQSDRADVFSIALEPGQTITYVAELSSERFARIFLWKPLAYELKVRERQLFNGTLLGLTGLMAIFLTAIFAANHKAIFPTAALVAWCVLVYLCVDFGFFHKLFNLRPEDNAVYRAAGEASIAASLVIFLYTFLRLGLGHGLVRMLFGVWMLAQLALIAVAVVDPRLSATFARLSFLLIGGAGAALVLFLAVRGQDRAMSLIPTWMLFLVWTFGTAVTLTGRMSGDIVVAGLAAGLVLVVVLIGFTVTQFAFRSMEPAYGSAPDEKQLRALAVDGVGAATWEWSARRDEIKVSPVLDAQLGLNQGELSTKVEDFLQHVHPGDRDRFRLVLWSIQERAGGRIRLEFRLRHSDNTYRWYELEAASVESADRRNVRCVGLLRDITDPKRTHERLLQDAVRCRVTDLPNREIFLDRLKVAGERSKSEPDIRPTIIFIDLDRFRSINQNLGLVVGDSLLLTIARRLKRHLGAQDTLARIGGDQFAVLLLNQQDPRELAGLAERIRRSLRSPIKIAGQDIVVTGSLGIAVYDGDGTSPEELLKGAEIAMYRAKRKGADRIEIYHPDMRSEASGLPLREQELRTALEEGQISVYFQPIVYLPTEELAGFEAVLRWEHPKHKLINHGTIIEIAEKCDLIKKVGNHLLLRSLESAKVWQKLLPRSEAPLFASINISNCQLFRPELVEEWRQIIGRHIAPPNCIRLEVSEALAMDNPERAIELMQALGAAGSEIVLDEFGAGYTSLTYLQRFPVGTIKVDKSIVQAGTSGEGEGAAVVRSVASLAHELGKKVLAEGVEIEEDVVFLRAIGCEYGQGLYYGEPMPGADVVELVKLIAKSERKLEAAGLFRTRPKKTKKKKRVDADVGGEAAQAPMAAAGAGSSQRPRKPLQITHDGAPQPNGARDERVPSQPQRPVADDVMKDARRTIASLPNVTVRPLERQQPPERARDVQQAARAGGGAAPRPPKPAVAADKPVAASQRANAAPARPVAPPTKPATAPPKNVVPPPQPREARGQPPAAPSPPQNPSPPAAASQRPANGTAKPPVPQPPAALGGVSPKTSATTPPAPTPASATAADPRTENLSRRRGSSSGAPVQDAALAFGKAVRGQPPAVPEGDSGKGAKAAQPPAVPKAVTPAKPPPTPPATPAASERPVATASGRGSVAGMAPASPVKASARASSEPAQAPPASTQASTSRPRTQPPPTPPAVQRPRQPDDEPPQKVAGDKKLPPTLPPPITKGGATLPPAAPAKPIAGAPAGNGGSSPANSDEDDPYAHLPPGIAASLRRLAGKGAAGGATAAQGLPASATAGGGPAVKKQGQG